jgi:hypothetical protein
MTMATRIPEIVTQAERESFMDRDDLTLDGLPALVLKAAGGFARVVRRDCKGGEVIYSWFAVRSVIETRDGAFRS